MHQSRVCMVTPVREQHRRSLAGSRNSQLSRHTTGHVRDFCKLLHHTVQSRLRALQLMREVIQHAGEGEEAGGEQSLGNALAWVTSALGLCLSKHKR